MTHPTLVIGQTYFVENPAGKSFVGRLEAIIDPFQVALTDASWVANTGRYHLFMKGQIDDDAEIEPCGRVAACRYQNVCDWPFPLPKKAK